MIVAILIIGTTTSILAWASSREQSERAMIMTLQTQATTLQDTLDRRLNVYSEILRGGTALFNAKQNQVSAEEWQRYMGSLDVRHRYPGTIAVGYVRFVDEAKTRSAVTYIEPLEAANRNVIGVDMFANQARRQAMERARDSGGPQLTQSLVLMRGPIKEERGVIYYAPVYRAGAPVATLEERRAAIEGFIYLPVRTKDLFAGIVGREVSGQTKLMIDEFDQQEGLIRIFTTTENRTDLVWPVRTTIRVGGVTWQVALAFDNKRNWDDDLRALGYLFGGILLTVSLASFVWVMVRARARELEFQQQMDVQAAKDDLVSLASHQLRTPATGVKQYLGMVLEGYAGRITKRQRQMLQQAFDSNERQIETVGQILHITRLESHRLKAHMRKLSLATLVNTVVEEQKKAAEERQHQVVVRHGGGATFEGDQQYIHMMIENLLSNAIKYTPLRGKIFIRTAADDEYVFLAIEDTGVGIAPEDYERMYEKFSRLDNALSVEAGGSGVGLYLIRLIVDEMHHGAIHVQSELGRGTTFTVILPRRHD